MKRNRAVIFLIILGLWFSPFVFGAKTKAKADKEGSKKGTDSGIYSGLKFRGIGPAFTSGRISDFAVNPGDHSEYYVAAAAGSVWKTVNSGVTWEPIFDKYGSWSIADVEIDPNNSNVVWVGTGEYNSQRAIGYGDGVYRSEDGGKSWNNMGLKKSEHIGRIVIDPRNSHVYVAAQGPLWGAGGDRGLYKSTDNGKTWKAILSISENTGVTDVVLDPRNPDIVYAAAYQRRRHVFTLINGGPESAIYKSIDAGNTWTTLKTGLPSGDVGRIGLSISPVNPDVIYAIIEATEKNGGFFRSNNRGASWQKMSDYVAGSPQYYNRIFADPKDVDRVYSVDTVTKVSVDGGKSFNALGNKSRHVDDHALWIDPTDTRHLLIGGDGGVYETFDGGINWLFKCNLPVTQFYRVSVDNAEPFYYVYGGTQDNNSMGGPSQTTHEDGIVNSDWFITNGGDGFKSQVDPENSDIIYAQAQYGWLVRYDKKSGESISIKPIEGKGEAYRWNWNAPLIISPHSHTRLYFAANILFRSDDRGNTWKKVSGDMSRQIDRNTLPVMGKVQSPEAVAKNSSTSLYGNIVSLTESPVKEGLLYTGTDDGLIHVSRDGGTSWQTIDHVPGVAKNTYVSCLYASRHEEGTVYASFDARKDNDLKPYVFKSTDYGKTWQSLIADLPERGTVYTIAQDNVKKDLLFVGTEFGIFFSIDGGSKWLQLKGGLPVIAVRDIVMQTRENDLAIATFGRGFYILDNYSPLRELTPEILKKEYHLFTVKDALMFVPRSARYGQGETLYKAENPEFGAVFTYYLKDAAKTLKQERKEEETKASKKSVPITYPTMDQLRAEDDEIAPYLVFTITDESGSVVRRIKKSPQKGINRLTWDLRYAPTTPVSIKAPTSRRRSRGGMPVLPGKFNVTASLVHRGVVKAVEGTQSFTVKPLNNTTLPAADRKELTDFQAKIGELLRVVRGTIKTANELEEKLKYITVALHQTPSISLELVKKADAAAAKLKACIRALDGDETISKRSENQPPSISDRVGEMVYGLWRTTSAPTQTMIDQYRIAGEEFEPQLQTLKELVTKDFVELDKLLDENAAPWTPGRLPDWKKK